MRGKMSRGAILQIILLALLLASWSCGGSDASGDLASADTTRNAGDNIPGRADIVTSVDGMTTETGDTAREDDGSSQGESPYGWQLVRCGEKLVSNCAECPDMPYACDPCDLSAVCVAECGDCHDGIACPGEGTCREDWQTCPESAFCGCPGDQKECHAVDAVNCVDSCATDCVGQPDNSYGVCAEEGGGCPDTAGPEFTCSIGGQVTCVDSCEECGEITCISQSCAGMHCEAGFVADLPYYKCDVKWCCDEGFMCPSTGECVADCAACGADFVGACGDRGTCVKDCKECPLVTGGQQQIEVCDGVCTDVFSNRWHCGGCSEVCGGDSDIAECSLGHCCIGTMSDMSPFVWCGECNCCLEDTWLCSEDTCLACIGL